MRLKTDRKETQDLIPISQAAMPKVKMSIVMIVLNGMPMIQYALESIYQAAHEIIIVEGAVEKCMFSANPDGSSIDGTVGYIHNFPDPEGKIKLVQGRWPEKCDMQNKALEYVTGDYVWLVDSDEVYREGDIATICELLSKSPNITQVNFICHNFWKSFDHIFVSEKLFLPVNHIRRIFKFVPGARFVSHRPPTMVHPGKKITTEQMHCIGGMETWRQGLSIYHYSYINDTQVKQKIELYRRYGWDKIWDIDLQNWYSEFYCQWTPGKRYELEKRYPVWTGDKASYSTPFNGRHPEVIRKDIILLEANLQAANDACHNRPQAKHPHMNATLQEPETFITPEIFNDEFYFEIRRLSSTEGVDHILEIGSSTGQGSTSAFVQGINRGGKKANLYCMEINPSRFEQLDHRYQNDDNVHCYMTSSVPLERYPEKKDIITFYDTTPSTLQQYPIEEVLGWLRQDRAHLENNNVPGDGIQMIKEKHNIKNFDVVLIDGSEFTGRAEMDDVYGAKVIMLDDINSYKNYDNYHRLKNDPVYQLEKENWNLRNGYAIFRKVAPVRNGAKAGVSEPHIEKYTQSFKKQDEIGLKKAHIVIDGVIFQHQAGRPHGIARVWQSLIEEWVRINGAFRITLLERDGFTIPLEGVTCQTIPEFQWGGHASLDKDDDMLRRVCQSIEADLFISTYYTRAPGVQNIVMVHDMIPELMKMDLSQPEWLSKKRALETSDGFICVSQTTQDTLINHYPYHSRQSMHVAYHGIQKVFRRSSTETIRSFRYAIGMQKPYVLLVGNRQGYKNGMVFLNALKQIPSIDRPCVLCVGGEAQLTHEEKRLQDELGTKYVGHLSDADLVAAYGGAEALIVPSQHEGFGLPVIEAMACGCPVIAQRSSAIAEVGGDAVIFADLSSIQDIRIALGMVSDQTQRSERIEKGLQHAAQYDWSETARSIDQFLMEQVRKPTPLISAIVSTYNAVAFIRGCLEDLENQTIANRMEIIVVDSGSEQNERRIVREFQDRNANIKYVRTQRETVYQAWNRGIKLARGKFITNANTDDRHRKDAFQKMASVLENNTHVALVYADVLKTTKANETFNTCLPSGVIRWPAWNRQELLRIGCFIGPQPVWRKKVHEIYGYFDEDYTISSDFEFWLRISQTFDFCHIGEPLGLYLDRPDSVEHANSEIKRDEDARIFAIYRDAADLGEYTGHREKVLSLCGKAKMHPNQNATKGNGPKKLCRSKTAVTKQGENMMSFSDTILNAVQYLVNGGFHEAARWSLDKLAMECPDDANIQFQAGQFAHQASDWEKAIIYLEAAVRLSPQQLEYRKCLGDYYYVVQKNAQKALVQYEGVLKIEPIHLETLTLAGHIATSLHQYGDAKKYYQRVLELDAGNSEIQEILGKLDRRSPDPQSIPASGNAHPQAAEHDAKPRDCHGDIASLEQLLRNNDNDAPTHNDLGVLYYGCGKMDDAQHHYQKAVALQPENITFQKNLADFYWAEKGDHARAMSRYVEVLKLDPQDIEAQLSSSQICLALGKEVDARDFIKMVLLIEPWNKDAQQLLDQIDAGLNGTNGESSGDALFQAAQEKASMGDVAGAITELQQLVEASPDDAKALNDLGVLYYESGNKNAALNCYKNAWRIEPDNKNYCKNLADIYLIDFDRAEDAMKLYLHVLEADPMDVESLLGSGLVCLAVGKPDDARDFYTRALEIDPSNDDARGALSNLAA